jgi:hypothetical protein
MSLLLFVNLRARNLISLQNVFITYRILRRLLSHKDRFLGYKNNNDNIHTHHSGGYEEAVIYKSI